MQNHNKSGLFLIITILSLFILSGCFLKAEKKPLFFKPPASIIDDYTGLMEGEEVNWVWLKLGTRLHSYPNITLKPFENLTSIEDFGIANRIYQGLLTWFEENDIIISDNGAFICKGAVVEFKPERAFYYDLNPFYENKDDDLFLELELVLVEKTTQEIVCKIRHGVTGPEINIIAEQVLADLIAYFDSHK